MGLFDFFKKKELEKISELEQKLERFKSITNIENEIDKKKSELKKIESEKYNIILVYNGGKYPKELACVITRQLLNYKNKDNIEYSYLLVYRFILTPKIVNNLSFAYSMESSSKNVLSG